PAPASPAAAAKVILASLACRYASVLRTIEVLAGRAIPGVQIVGGGSRNDYLSQATADATGRAGLGGAGRGGVDWHVARPGDRGRAACVSRRRPAARRSHTHQWWPQRRPDPAA